MNTNLAGKVDHVSAYIDDIAIFSNTIEKHFQHLEGVFEKLAKGTWSHCKTTKM